MYVRPYVTTQYEAVKNCNDMIFSALRIFLVVFLRESINGPVSNVQNLLVLLFWLGSYGQL